MQPTPSTRFGKEISDVAQELRTQYPIINSMTGGKVLSLYFFSVW